MLYYCTSIYSCALVCWYVVICSCDCNLVWLVSVAMIVDLMLFEADVVTIKLMWSKYVPILATLMLDQYDHLILPQFTTRNPVVCN